MDTAIRVFLLAVSYLLGSIPVGYLIVKKRKGIDIRTVGSGSMGATNVASQCGWRWGIITIIGDFLKSFIPVSIAAFLVWGIHWLTGLVGLFCVIGHVFPVFIPPPKFKGGKGVATTAGFLVPMLILICGTYPHLWIFLSLGGIIAAWIAILKSFKRMGAASLFLMACVMIFFGVLEFQTRVTYLSLVVFCIASLVLWAHRANWKRLYHGTERILESQWEKQ
jgi:glycerol-3-phosphate acyltransferase PlsY